MIFKIGNTDLTKCIVHETYKINRQDDVAVWKDANNKRHFKLKGSQITGSLDLYMRSEEYQTAYISALANEKNSDGTYNLTLSVNNTHTDESIVATLTADPTRKTVGVRDTFDAFTLTVEES